MFYSGKKYVLMRAIMKRML